MPATADILSKLGEGIRSFPGFIGNGYWFGGLVDATLKLESVCLPSAVGGISLGISWWGIGIGLTIAAITAYCDYDIHLTHSAQLQTQSSFVFPDEIPRLTCSRKTKLTCAFIDDSCSVAGQYKFGTDFALRLLTPSTTLSKALSLLGTFGLGAIAAFQENRNHITSQLRDQIEKQDLEEVYRALDAAPTP